MRPVRQEDRKRLKEKLKSAFEAVQLSGRAGGKGQDALRGRRGGRPPGTPWLEYVFGICPPDQRVGKRGSRCAAEGRIGLRGCVSPMVALGDYRRVASS